MRFVILTQDAPPKACGIADHSVKLAESLRAEGHRVSILARYGSADDDLFIVPGQIGDAWLAAVTKILDELSPGRLILQYTPLIYSGGNRQIERDLALAWKNLAQRWPTAVIVHETYFRVWWYPPSLLSGSFQKRALRNVVRTSDYVFSASEPLVREMGTWNPSRPVVRVPIGSNLPPVLTDTDFLRRTHGLTESDIVLTLFGGGKSLKWMAGHVNAVENNLTEKGIGFRWLLLGGAPANWFKFRTPPIAPGRLQPNELSAYLQLTDIFLMPHSAGLCAKRGTLMAALEHGLPAIGTIGNMTDSFWSRMPGVIVTPIRDVPAFVDAVRRVACDGALRQSMGLQNAEYYRNRLSWPIIAKSYVQAFESSPQETSPVLRTSIP